MGLNFINKVQSHYWVKSEITEMINILPSRWKNSVCGTFQDLLKSFVSFGGGLEGFNEEKTEEVTEGRASRVKCREALLEWRGRLVKILWDSPCVMVQ